MAISCHSRSVSYGHRRASSFLALSAIRTEGDSRYLRRNWKTSRRRSRNASSRSTTLKKLAGKCTSMSVAVPCVQEDQPIPKTRHSSTRISMARNSGLWYFGSTFGVRRSTFGHQKQCILVGCGTPPPLQHRGHRRILHKLGGSCTWNSRLRWGIPGSSRLSIRLGMTPHQREGDLRTVRCTTSPGGGTPRPLASQH